MIRNIFANSPKVAFGADINIATDKSKLSKPSDSKFHVGCQGYGFLEANSSMPPTKFITQQQFIGIRAHQEERTPFAQVIESIPGLKRFFKTDKTILEVNNVLNSKYDVSKLGPKTQQLYENMPKTWLDGLAKLVKMPEDMKTYLASVSKKIHKP